MSPIKITTYGELEKRLILSCQRLDGEHYHPDYIWSADKNCWPGDWEGRTILALSSLAKATGKEPAYLDEIMDKLESHLNSKGYMGEIYGDTFNEQQMSGNSWLMRGIIEYSILKQTDRFVSVIRRMVENLYLPVINVIDEYPLKKVVADGEYSGSIIAKHKSWQISTDIGCVYISLDGITKAYEFLKEPKLLVLIDKMISRFNITDILKEGFQTHATLSCLRGIIRAYRITGKKEYLKIATKRYEDYLKYGMTQNYENTNWFFAYEWTEPCGIVDSYICSIKLFELTGEKRYLDIAQKIYYNGLCRVQLPNGGFAIDECVGYKPIETLKFIQSKESKPIEAYWCCTMRGANGLSYVYQNQCIKTDKKYQFINYFDSIISDEDIQIKVQTKYPLEGKMNFTVNNPYQKEIELCLYLPEFISGFILKKDGSNIKQITENGFAIVEVSEKQTEITLEFDIMLRKEEAFTADNVDKYFTLWHGNLILGTYSAIDTVNLDEFVHIGQGKYELTSGKGVFSPIGDTFKKSDADLNNSIKLMFLK